MAKKKPDLEGLFLATWLEDFPELPPPERQVNVNPERPRQKWDFGWRGGTRKDRHFWWPDLSNGICVDINGGTFMRRSGHSGGLNQEKDWQKCNEAIILGWKPLVFGTASLKDPHEVVYQVAIVLTGAK